MSPNIFNKLMKRLKATHNKPDEGIITLADKNYFEGLIILYHSVQACYPVPIQCFDIGLLNEQKAWASKHLPMLTILDIPDDPRIKKIKTHKEKINLRKKGKRQWALWICPFLIQNSPFTKTLWLDCDIIILKDLEHIFKNLESAPFFTPENLAPQVTANKPQLYQLLPIQREVKEDSALINAGVSGWHLKRDKKILRSYAFAVEQAFNNEKIKNAIAWHDQGALIWAILKTGSEHCITPDWKWNLCVKHTSAKALKFKWSPALLDQLREQVPEANVLHWNGQTVPWNE